MTLEEFISNQSKISNESELKTLAKFKKHWIERRNAETARLKNVEEDHRDWPLSMTPVEWNEALTGYEHDQLDLGGE